MNGVELSALSQPEQFKFRRETVSFVFQTFNLFPSLTALENVEFALDLAHNGHQPRAHAAEILASVGLAERMAHFPHELSGGGSNALRSRGRWRPAIRSSWPTSRRVSLTFTPACRSSICSSSRPRTERQCWS